MKYPLYDEKDLHFSSEDGDHLVSEFADFISQLAEREILDNNIEKGIVALVDSKGTKALSEKQQIVLNIIVSRYVNFECNVCGNKIPLNEALDYDENDGLCSYHKNQFDKDDD